MELKGIDEITNILNNFLKKYEVTAEIDTDFSYYYQENVIGYSLVIPQKMDETFLKFAKTLGLNYNIDVFLLSTLHELGHHCTLDDIDDVEYWNSQKIKKTLTTSEEDCLLYYNLVDEIAATQWAVDFINDNPEEIRNLWNKLQPAIMNFYIENNIQ